MKNLCNLKECHAELGSASGLKSLDPEIEDPDPEMNSG